MMDDPNLHAATYGYVDYEKVVVDAQDLGFHLSVATIPLDGWFTSARTASIFRNHPRELSLLIHGNSHTKHELEDAESSVTPLQVLAQSIRRIQRFEQRSDVDVAQVMAAPHGRCSHESATAMARLGFESICITRPFPWLDRPPSEFPLAGWFPADTYSVMPTMGRVPLSVRPEEIALRAFLGQPIVLYGHESDLGVQPDLFSSWAEHVARLDDVPWASVKDISRGLVSWRTDGETLWVRPHTRMIEVAAPLGIERLIVEADGPGYETVTVTDGAGGSIAAPLSNGIAEMPVSGRPGKLTIRVQPGEVVDPDSIPAPRWSPWPLTRRMLTEARDRSRPRIDAWRRR
jgi:hypothetical protein